MPADTRGKGRRRPRTPSPSNTLNEILRRLQNLEERARGSEPLSASVVAPEPRRALAMPSTPLPAVEPATTPICATPASARDVAATPTSMANDARSVAERFLDAIIQFPVRSNQYFVSDFDQSVHDVDTWCNEVDKAKSINHWEDSECLARIGRCLKSEARTWRGEWTPDTCAGFFESFEEDQDPLSSHGDDEAGPSTRTDEGREDAALSGEAVLDGNTV